MRLVGISKLILRSIFKKKQLSNLLTGEMTHRRYLPLLDAPLLLNTGKKQTYCIRIWSKTHVHLYLKVSFPQVQRRTPEPPCFHWWDVAFLQLCPSTWSDKEKM